MDEDRLDALERLGVAQNEIVQLLVDHVRALAVVNVAMLGTLDDAGRAVVREASLGGLGAGPEHTRAAALVGLFTHDPVVTLAASNALAGSQSRLQ